MAIQTISPELKEQIDSVPITTCEGCPYFIAKEKTKKGQDQGGLCKPPEGELNKISERGRYYKCSCLTRARFELGMEFED